MGRLSQSLLVLVFVLAAAAAGPGAPRAAIMSTGGPNPNWTEMQKYEWYVGYLANFSAPPAHGSRTPSPRWRPTRRRQRSPSSSPTTADHMATPATTPTTGT